MRPGTSPGRFLLTLLARSAIAPHASNAEFEADLRRLLRPLHESREEELLLAR
jgi:hypothetical protein